MLSFGRRYVKLLEGQPSPRESKVNRIPTQSLTGRSAFSTSSLLCEIVRSSSFKVARTARSATRQNRRACGLFKADIRTGQTLTQVFVQRYLIKQHSFVYVRDGVVHKMPAAQCPETFVFSVLFQALGYKLRA